MFRNGGTTVIRSKGALPILEDGTMAPPICIAKIGERGRKTAMSLATEGEKREQMARAFAF
jgi:hypothetical protein